MAFKLTKDEEKKRTELIDRLRTELAKIEDQQKITQVAIDDAIGEFQAVVEKYQEALEDAKGFCDDVAARFRDEFDDKSDAWKESDKGQEAEQFVSVWEDASFEEVGDVEKPELEELEIEEDHAISGASSCS